jgi:hypothetical protein
MVNFWHIQVGPKKLIDCRQLRRVLIYHFISLPLYIVYSSTLHLNFSTSTPIFWDITISEVVSIYVALAATISCADNIMTSIQVARTASMWDSSGSLLFGWLMLLGLVALCIYIADCVGYMKNLPKILWRSIRRMLLPLLVPFL